MLELRRSGERGHVNHGWLDSYHSFSFSSYYDPKHVDFGPLRVINEDRVIAGAGFATHSHQDMEILSYVLEGELAHKDSIGTGSVIRPGDVQRMSAGRGVTHSEFNQSKDTGVHFLQIWIKPAVLGIPASYEQKHFDEREKRGRLRLIASADAADGSVTIHQDARVYAGLFHGEEQASLALAAGRRGYVHVARGSIDVNGTPLATGDALKLTETSAVTISRGRAAEVLAFDLPQ
ncbi:MAG TPA: pirin family protein [Steroidobacteraceae bacterium]|nr:pirin family protein [Steroidobacteraceae bacterium]